MIFNLSILALASLLYSIDAGSGTFFQLHIIQGYKDSDMQPAMILWTRSFRNEEDECLN